MTDVQGPLLVAAGGQLRIVESMRTNGGAAGRGRGSHGRIPHRGGTAIVKSCVLEILNPVGQNIELGGNSAVSNAPLFQAALLQQESILRRTLDFAQFVDERAPIKLTGQSCNAEIHNEIPTKTSFSSPAGSGRNP